MPCQAGHATTQCTKPSASPARGRGRLGTSSAKGAARRCARMAGMAGWRSACVRARPPWPATTAMATMPSQHAAIRTPWESLTPREKEQRLPLAGGMGGSTHVATEVLPVQAPFTHILCCSPSYPPSAELFRPLSEAPPGATDCRFQLRATHCRLHRLSSALAPGDTGLEAPMSTNAGATGIVRCAGSDTAIHGAGRLLKGPGYLGERSGDKAATQYSLQRGLKSKVLYWIWNQGLGSPSPKWNRNLANLPTHPNAPSDGYSHGMQHTPKLAPKREPLRGHPSRTPNRSTPHELPPPLRPPTCSQGLLGQLQANDCDDEEREDDAGHGDEDLQRVLLHKREECLLEERLDRPRRL